MSTDTAATGHAHPTPGTYAKVAIILTAITLLEFWTFYIPALQTFWILVPLLGIMSAVKFALVVMFYMHLRYDHKVFSQFLILGTILAFAVFLALMVLFFISHPLMR